MGKYIGIREITDKLKSVKTQEEKREILEYYSYETLLKRVLRYTYSPLITYNLDDWTPKHRGTDGGIGMSKFMHVPEDIFQGKFTQEEAEFACDVALMRIADTEAEIFIGMLKKDIGVDLEIATINSVWPNLILEYPLQSAKEFNTSDISSFTFPAVAQKFNSGFRVNIIVRGNSVEFRDRYGKVLHNFAIYVEQFSNLAQNGSIVFDGVAVVVDEQLNIVSTDDSDVLSSNAENVRFILWDTIRYDGFVEGKDNRIGYNWRFNGLEHMMFLAVDKNSLPCYRASESKMVTNLEEAERFAKEIKNPIVLKNLSGTWKNGVSDYELIIRN